MTTPEQKPLGQQNDESAERRTLGHIAYEAHSVALRYAPPLIPANWWHLKPYLRDAWETAAVAAVKAAQASPPAYVPASGFPL